MNPLRLLGNGGRERGPAMDSTVMSRATEANDALAARANERLAHAYEQIANADEQLARLTEQMTRMEQDAARPASAMLLKRPSRGRPLLRGFIGVVAAACIIGGGACVAVVLWRNSRTSRCPVGGALSRLGFLVAACEARAGHAAVRRPSGRGECGAPASNALGAGRDTRRRATTCRNLA